jgi:hypothetical protein
MTDYVVIVLYVLDFMSMGDAHILKLQGCLDCLDHCPMICTTTMESRSFHIIEQRITPIMQDLPEEMLLANLTEEVRLTMLSSPEQWMDS